jgi:hypothetical protein
VQPDDWFLTAEERGNAGTGLDRRRGDGKAWTDGNRVRVLIHGAEYFPNLYETVCTLENGDWVHFTDWEGDPDERLAGPDTEVGRVFADLVRRGIHVRGLVWRSHPRQAHFSEQQNTQLVREINESGGTVVLDESVGRGGSHHQKLVLVRRASRPDDDVAFVGGIDLCHGRNDGPRHEGDPQVVDVDPRYGDRTPSRRTGSAASDAPTGRRCVGLVGSSMSRIRTSGPRSGPTRCGARPSSS